jgi:hypothetical protein
MRTIPDETRNGTQLNVFQMTNSFGSLLQGAQSSGKLTSLKCFAQFLGRHVITLAHFGFSNMQNMESLLFCMESTQDLVCIRDIKVATF